MVTQLSGPAITVVFTAGESSTTAEKTQVRIMTWSHEVAGSRIIPLSEGSEMLVIYLQQAADFGTIHAHVQEVIDDVRSAI